MNYGKQKASKKQKAITSKTTMQGKRLGVRLFKAFLLCMVVVMIAGVTGGFLFIKRIIDNSPTISPSDVRPSGYTTFVYADDGTTEIERFITSGSNRVYKSLDEIPKYLQHAFVAVEDERFYQHHGIDPQGIVRAALKAVMTHHLSEGASTITQQLIKNNVFPNFVAEKTNYDKIERKLQEQFLALNIEKQMSKDEILESYMNTINLGQNTLGVQAASKRYFNKDVSELTLSESAVIAGITQFPSKYDPVQHPEENRVRRDEVLLKMLEQGYIDQASYDEALADDVYARIQDVNSQIGEDSPYSYFVDALSQQIIDDFVNRLGYTETQAYNALYSGGLKIISTQNLALQRICDEEMNNDANYPYLKEVGLSYALTVTRADGSVENFGSGNIKKFVLDNYGDKQGLLFSTEEEARSVIEQWKATIAREGDTYDESITLTPQPQASVTLMDQATGQIKALVGGRGAKPTSQSLNRAYKGSKRQPGSCFKILSTYAPALDSCEKTLATVIRDEPWQYADGSPLKNATGKYMGDITMRTAIEYSQNVCAIKMIDEITPQLGYEYVRNFGIDTVYDSIEINGDIYSDINQSLALGGLTEGVYNYQLCAAFASIANGGVYNSPTLYTQIIDHDGNILLEGNADTHTVLKDTTAALLTSAMTSVVDEGTGTAAKLSNMPVAGKTGTSDHDVDLWFCGFTPYYTCTVWGGYDENKSLTNIDTTYRFRIWRSIMSRVHENLAYQEFEMPYTLQQKTVCTLSGLLASPGCPSVKEYFSPETVPYMACTGHGSLFDKEDEEEEEENTPSNPSTPSNPTTPTNPTNPTNPSTPTTPTNPTNPTNPTTPTNPTDPSTPTT